MKRDHSNLVKKHFTTEWMKYGQYDNFVKKVCPGYEEMHKLIIKQFIPSKKRVHILDIGLGTGKTTQALLKKFPNAKIDGVDISASMIKKAKARLKKSKKVHFIEEDIKKFFSDKKYDFCVAVLSLHHLRHQEKKDVFRKIYYSLKDQGLFVIGDRVNFKTEKMTKERISSWKAYLNKIWGKETGKSLFVMFDKEDIPSKVTDQVHWLKNIGFSKVKIVWNYSIYAVFYAQK
ncbi:class I SAM-dependent methyltransferase [Candidatus Woesearchaeota archaeon]|nr:class I SAM-dependent methyltransferase [Candidatus Woesearchaeota archaeon]